MLGNHFTLSFFLAGTLSANHIMRWIAPFDCQVKHISACATNDSDATLKVGLSDDDDEILAAYAIGDSGTPNEKTVDNYTSLNPTGRLLDGEILLLTLDFDGSAGTAAQNVSIVVTLTEG